jgi:hypothetical protein
MTEVNLQLITELANQKIEQAKQNQLDMTALSYAMGQNAATAASMQQDASVSYNGRTESISSMQQRMQAELETQQRSRAFASSIDYDALSFSLLEQTKQTGAERLALRNKLDQQASVSLFDDPLGAIANAFTMPWTEQALEQKTAKLNELQDLSSKVNTQINGFADTSNKIKEAITQESLRSVTAAIQTDQKIKEIEATNKALAINAQGIEWTAKASSDQLNAANVAYTALATEENRKYQRQMASAALEQRDLERQAIRSDKVAKEAIFRDDLDLVKDALRQSSPDGKIRLTDDQIANGLRRNDPMVKALVDRGMVMRIQGRAAFGENPGETLRYAGMTGFQADPSSKQAIVMDTVAGAWNAAVASGAKDKETLAASSKATLRAQFEQWESDVGSGSKNNPLGIPAYDYLGNTNAIVTNPGFEYIKDLVASDATSKLPVDVQAVYGRLIEATASGKIKSADAVRLIADIGRSSALYNKDVNKLYELTGLTQTKAIVKIAPGSAIGNALIDAAPLIGLGAALATGGTGTALSLGVTSMVTAGVGYMEASRTVDMNLLDPVDIAQKFSLGLAAKFSKEVK